ncbi:hypothetical protein V865_000563 [Kwoniella europaea PYCC6329]|uniref:FAS1 domain-containing protein n=1 Tax=Kwoniella europaea PYCC6329 TaxID=1423913 RepID=A0AAX4K9R2_9TREE
MQLSILPFFTILSILFPTSLAQLDTDIICPDGSLTEYLTSIMDVLFTNGLTTFEQLIVHWSETDMGYEFLHDLYNSGQKLTVLVPPNDAFQESGIVSPFEGLTEDWGTELGELHLLQGEWTCDQIPQSGHAVAATSLLLANELNSTDIQSNAYQAMVLERGNDNAVIFNGWWGNATSTSGPLDLSGSGGLLLDNLIILPIDHVLSFPPSLSTALQSPGLTNMSSALQVVGKSSDVEQLTEGGFTIFVPLDSVWNDEVKDIMVDASKAPEMVGNHFTTSYSLFSPMWIELTSFELPVESGGKLTIQYNQDGSSLVIYGEVEAKIVRSDITLNNGVMHIIDQILYPTSSSSSNTKSNKPTTTSSIPSTADSTSASIPDGSNDDSDGEGKAVIPDAPTNSTSSTITLSVTLLVCLAVGWLVVYSQ